jgi:hypothetical protein
VTAPLRRRIPFFRLERKLRLADLIWVRVNLVRCPVELRSSQGSVWSSKKREGGKAALPLSFY